MDETFANKMKEEQEVAGIPLSLYFPNNNNTNCIDNINMKSKYTYT
jgi:hypothetical protein